MVNAVTEAMKVREARRADPKCILMVRNVNDMRGMLCSQRCRVQTIYGSKTAKYRS